MIINFKNFEENSDINNIQTCLKNHISGYKNRIDWIYLIKKHFNGEIPSEFKYYGKVWKTFFFQDIGTDLMTYYYFLRNGIENLPDQNIYSCTKDINCNQDIINDLGDGCDLYITVELNSTEENCVFDLNNICDEFSVHNSYKEEKEVILYADKVKITKDNIISYGKINEKYDNQF